MNRKRLAVMMAFLVANALLESCYGQRGDWGGDHHHHHHDGSSGGRGVLGGLGAALGIAGAGLLAAAVTRGVTGGGMFGGRAYPVPVAYPQPVAPVAYPVSGYAGAGYAGPYAGSLATGYGGGVYGGGVYGGGVYGGGAYSPLVAGATYGGYPGGVSSSRRVTTVSDSSYSNVY